MVLEPAGVDERLQELQQAVASKESEARVSQLKLKVSLTLALIQLSSPPGCPYGTLGSILTRR